MLWSLQFLSLYNWYSWNGKLSIILLLIFLFSIRPDWTIPWCLIDNAFVSAFYFPAVKNHWSHMHLLSAACFLGCPWRPIQIMWCRLPKTIGLRRHLLGAKLQRFDAGKKLLKKKLLNWDGRCTPLMLFLFVHSWTNIYSAFVKIPKYLVKNFQHVSLFLDM
jgi:hypothetical protein